MEIRKIPFGRNVYIIIMHSEPGSNRISHQDLHLKRGWHLHCCTPNLFLRLLTLNSHLEPGPVESDIKLVIWFHQPEMPRRDLEIQHGLFLKKKGIGTATTYIEN